MKITTTKDTMFHSLTKSDVDETGEFLDTGIVQVRLWDGSVMLLSPPAIAALAALLPK